MIAKSITIKGWDGKSGRCVVKAVELTFYESPLNNSFWPSSASAGGCSLIDRDEQGDENNGVKKPQLPQDHPQVVTSSA